MGISSYKTHYNIKYKVPTGDDLYFIACITTREGEELGGH
jgi:hypothetical protein